VSRQHSFYLKQSYGSDTLEENVTRHQMRATKATYKLGIEFKDWGKLGDSYIHPFGDYGLPGQSHAKSPFHHCITRAEQSGQQVEGRINEVDQNSETGNIQTVTLEDGQALSADFFIDCSGFRGLLISQTLKTPYQDWTQYLPCNRAVTAACEAAGPTLPYTRATAKTSGWQWRIPLQHRVGNGYVYSSEYISDDDAESSMLTDLEGAQISDAKRLRFTTGQRQNAWVKNCVAIGLAGGFLEPLESTGIYLIIMWRQRGPIARFGSI